MRTAKNSMDILIIVDAGGEMTAVHDNPFLKGNINIIVIDRDEGAEDDKEALDIPAIDENDDPDMEYKAWVLHDDPAYFDPILIRDIKERIKKWRA